jgi:hypothetical protein
MYLKPDIWLILGVSANTAKLQLLQTDVLKTKMGDDKNLAAVTIRCVMLKT